MSNKYVLNFAGRAYEVEDFTDAFVCRGRVFFRQRVEYRINSDPGQAWGVYIDVPSGACVDGKDTDGPCTLCIDDIGQSHTVTELLSAEPLRMRSTRFVGTAYPAYGESEDKPRESCNIASLRYTVEDGCAYVNGFSGAEHTLLIPCQLGGVPVKRLDLRECELGNVETLIISEGIDELAINFRSAAKLSRLQIPEGVRLLCPLDDISATPWFRSQRPEPIIMAGCYCGTPGGGSGGVRSLVLPEGVESVAAGADFHSYWNSIKTPESLRSIGKLAFATNHCLEELNLGEGLREICDGAFFSAQRLKSLYLPDSLTQLGENCFSRCFSLQEVSVPGEEQAERFIVHSLTIRLAEGEKQLSLCPPIVYPIRNRISAYPAGGTFHAAGKPYRSLDEVCAHRMNTEEWTHLDIHGRKAWRIRVRSDCIHDKNGERKVLECLYIKTDSEITQIQQLDADGSILVEDDISPLDIPYEMRSIVQRMVFEA